MNFFKKMLPVRKEGDQLYNRRVLSYLSLLFSVFWFQEVLILVGLGYFFDVQLAAPVVIALLGVPASLAGLGFWRYLEACKHSEYTIKKDPAE